MSLEDYLKQNIKPDILQKATEFKNSSNYQAIKTYTSSHKYQAAKTSLKIEIKVYIKRHLQILKDYKIKF